MRILSFMLVSIVISAGVFAEENDPPIPQRIKRVDLVMHSHTDIGYTDHPLVTRKRQMQYLDIAVDAVLATKDAPQPEKFYWTAEATHCVDDWWREATPARREAMLRAIRTGQLEITAMAMNQTPLMNRAQWDLMVLGWLPPEVRKTATVKVAMQNDVNGCPRAGAMRLLDRGVPFLWMSINGFNGGAPARQPSAFWWKMPDGRKLFVWLNTGYGDGFYFFHDFDWRQGPVPESTDTRYRLPREGDFFHGDEASVRKCHRHLCHRLAALERSGYDYPSLPLSFTNQWRIDNDPPFPHIPAFVATWNRLGLKPELRLTTAAAALESLQKNVGDTIPVCEGEFTDWWANGSASGPREVAASRHAKRLLAAAASPVFGPMSPAAKEKYETILRELCFFDEHTWGSVDSVGRPHDLDVLGQYNEKSRYAYHAGALAKLLLAERARSHTFRQPPGYYVINTAPEPYSGWVTVPASAFREHVAAFRDSKTNRVIPVQRRRGFASFSRANSPDDIFDESRQGTIADHAPDQAVRFWVENIPGRTARRLLPADPNEAATPEWPSPTVEVDAHGWPVSARWGDHVLFDQPPGNFVAVDFSEFNGRWLYGELLHSHDETRRRNTLRWTYAAPAESPQGQTEIEETPYSIRYTQTLAHPRLMWLKRTLELRKGEPRADLTVRFYRISSELPEWFFIGASLAANGETLPVATCGGLPFTPFHDQIPGTCRDYFGIDGCLLYSSADTDRAWISRDAPLVTFGKTPEPLQHRQAPPEAVNTVHAMVYDNTWLTNFPCDQPGVMEFRFTLLLQPKRDANTIDALTETVLAEPVFVQHAESPESELYMKHLHCEEK